MSTKALAKKGQGGKAQPHAARKVGMGSSIEESKALVKRGSTDIDEAPQTTAVAYKGEANFDREDVDFPRLRLAQGLTPEVTRGEAEMGQWVLLGNDPVDSVTVVPLVYGKGRVCKEDPKDRDSEIVCTSQDGHTGVGNPGGDCARCPMAAWGPKNKKGKSAPPQCNQHYSYGMWSETHQAIIMLNMEKTQLAVAKQLNTVLMQKGFGTIILELGSASKTGPNGEYKVPTFKVVKPSDADEILQRAVENNGWA